MFEVLSQLPTMDLTVILWVSMAFSALGLVVIARILATVRAARDRRILAKLVLEMLEQGFSPMEITALLRVIGIPYSDEPFHAVRRRLFEHYARRRAETPPPLPKVVARASRQLQPAV